MNKKKCMVKVISAVSAVALTLMLPGGFSGVRKVSAASVSDLEQQVKELEREQQELKNKAAEYSKDLDKQQEAKEALEDQIANVRSQISLLSQQETAINNQIAEMNATIQQKEQEIVEKQAQIDESFTLLQQRLRAIFKSGNMSGLQMLLDTDEYADYLIKSKMMERISENDQELMDGLEAEMQQINAEKEQVVAQKAEVEQQEQEIAALKAQADEKKNEMDSLYSQVNAVVKQLQSDISYTEQQLKEKKAQEEALNQQIADLINSTESTGKYGGGTMFWPVPTVRNISSGFGSRWGTVHRGIDIANGSVPIYGEKIYAAESGTVIYSNYTSTWGGGYGYYCIVDHGLDSKGRRISTLYAHTSKMYARVGDKVTRGKTVLALAGDTGNVTGPHLHFEVRVNGVAVDPIKNGYVSLNK